MKNKNKKEYGTSPLTINPYNATHKIIQKLPVMIHVLFLLLLSNNKTNK